MTLTFLEKTYPSGGSASGLFIFPVNTRDPKDVERDSDLIRFRFFDQMKIEYDKEEILEGPKKNFSGYFYNPKSVLFTLEELKKEHPEQRSLAELMVEYEWPEVIFVLDHWYPFFPKDRFWK